MAQHIGMDSFPVDIGVARDVEGARILRRKVRYGTADMTQEPAMTREEAVRALETGIELAEWCAAQGYRLVCAGEMGIGNTTSSAAVTAALTGAAVRDVTGRGAGLSTEGLERKVKAIERALALHRRTKTIRWTCCTRSAGWTSRAWRGFTSARRRAACLRCWTA